MTSDPGSQTLDTNGVAELLVEIGQRTELSGDSPFKARAYYTAAENLRAETRPLAELVAQKKLRTIPGVGEAIEEKIARLHRTGSHPTLEFLREQYPAGLLKMMSIPGLGPKKVMIVYQDLKLSTIEELEAACHDGRIAGCKGLGKALQEKILKGLELFRRGEGQLLMDIADSRLTSEVTRLRQAHPELTRIEVAGTMRRGCELIDDFIIAAAAPVGFQLPPVASGVEVRLGTAENFGATLLFATGSKPHLDALIARAKDQGMTLSPDGLKKKNKVLDSSSEEAIYSALGLSFIPSELREGAGEIESAEKKTLPQLVELKDLRGILHSHTTFSDGARTLAEMAEAVKHRGYQYYGVADHSRTAAYAGGMKEDKVRAQLDLANELNAKYHGKGFRIFKGVESDILEDGSLDYPDDLLHEFDFIVASIHSRFSLDKKAQTERLIKAVSNPYTTILGHMTGRQLLKRDGYDIDIEAVLKACSAHGVAVEINANPRRLDLDWRWLQKALELGCTLSINPDAHDIGEIDLVRYGVAIARKGGVPASKVLNCMTLDQITTFLSKARNTR
jgi:DNA polymerase (family 10)